MHDRPAPPSTTDEPIRPRVVGPRNPRPVETDPWTHPDGDPRSQEGGSRDTWDLYEDDEGGPSRGIVMLLLGAPAAFLFTLPIAQYMGWFLASLVHEMGHSLAAWLCGCPAFPAIRLDGHAAAIHGQQEAWFSGFLSLCMLGGAAFLWKREARVTAISIAVGAIVLPIFALNDTPREFLFLSMGHGGELLFAAICFHRALSGGFTHADEERVLYATLGWFLIGRNAILFFGLFSDAAARARYHGNGSFGLENDMIRLARDVMGWSLPSVGLLFLVLTLLAAPAGLLLGRVFQREA